MPYAARMTSRSSSSDRTSMKLGGDGASYHLRASGTDGGSGPLSRELFNLLSGLGLRPRRAGRGGIERKVKRTCRRWRCARASRRRVGPRRGAKPRRRGRRRARRRRRPGATKRRPRACGATMSGRTRVASRAASWSRAKASNAWIPRGARWTRALARFAGSSSDLRDAPVAREARVVGGEGDKPLAGHRMTNDSAFEVSVFGRSASLSTLFARVDK